MYLVNRALGSILTNNKFFIHIFSEQITTKALMGSWAPKMRDLRGEISKSESKSDIVSLSV